MLSIAISVCSCVPERHGLVAHSKLMILLSPLPPMTVERSPASGIRSHARRSPGRRCWGFPDSDIPASGTPVAGIAVVGIAVVGIAVVGIAVVGIAVVEVAESD